MALIPILKVKKFVDLLLAFVKADYENATVKTNSFLYKVLGDNIDNGWDFYTQGVEIFTKRGTDNRQLETRVMFDRSRAGLPTIHVREPAKGKGVFDGIGFLGEGIFVNEAEVVNGITLPSTISSTVRKSFKSNFELMITSGNSLECVVIQEVLESAMLASLDSLTIDFFELIDFASKELMMNNDSERSGLFIKTIELAIGYEKSNIPKLYTEENIKIIQFENPTLLDI